LVPVIFRRDFVAVIRGRDLRGGRAAEFDSTAANMLGIHQRGYF